MVLFTYSHILRKQTQVSRIIQKHSNNNNNNKKQRKKEKRKTRECDNAKAEFVQTTEIKAGGVRRKDPSRDECKGDSKLAPCTAAAAAVKSLQSCRTLCDPIDGSPPGSPIPGFLREEHWSGLPFPSPIHETEK